MKGLVAAVTRCSVLRAWLLVHRPGTLAAVAAMTKPLEKTDCDNTARQIATTLRSRSRQHREDTLRQHSQRIVNSHFTPNTARHGHRPAVPRH